MAKTTHAERRNGASAASKARWSASGARSPRKARRPAVCRAGELTVERFRVTQAPEPKADLKLAMRAQVAKLAEAARPSLRLERGRAEPVFGDSRRDFGVTESYIAGLLCWLHPDAMVKRLDAMVDALPDGEAMTTEDQQKELAELAAEIEALGRQEEALIDAAFAGGVDILRRSGADPACVLGVRVRLRVAAARPPRRPRPAPPAAAEVPAAADVIETPAVAVAEPIAARCSADARSGGRGGRVVVFACGVDVTQRRRRRGRAWV